MRKSLLVVAAVAPLLVGLSLPAQAAAGPLVQVTKATGQAVPGHYIVTVADGVAGSAIASALSVRPTYVYTAALNGFAAQLTNGQVNALQRNPNIVRIEEDGVVHATATQTNPPWGLDRIDQRNLPLSATYTYNRTGAGVNAYIIDTGIQANHPQFGTRARSVYDALGGTGADCNGHGTHVAGTIGGSTYGVAKAANLRGVRVLNCSGSGTWAQVISGMDWVTANHVKPAVANMSLGGGLNSSVNAAATRMANAGVFTAVAAGNSNANACSFSPASASNVTTVAASDRTDLRASFSNYGSCVEVYAPGVAVLSSWINSGTNTISGTSMASPHVAGVGVLYKSNFGDVASSTLNTWIINNATTGVIRSNPTGTPNRLLFKSTL
ncbi:MAG TPA: S8 family peptidase [Pseudonocardiaceae bacterium]|nr:S8 family peptidase [Pseudonocardiaceae bacterium]